MLRAAGLPDEEIDAPGDVACARADGVRCVAVTGHFGPQQLDGAQALIAALDELPGVVGGFLPGTSSGTPPG